MIGRPRKFTDATDLYNTGLRYIQDTLNKGEHLTFTGLCIALDTTRETFGDYESGKYDTSEQPFSDSIKRLKQYCENYAEQRIFSHNPAGAIFALKNYGWKDRQELDVNADLDAQINVKFVQDEDED